MSRALDILTAIQARLAQIRVAGGYATDIGARVYLGRAHFDDAEVPLAALLEIESKVSGSSRDQQIDADIVVEAHDVCDPDAPLVKGHALVADICRAVLLEDRTLSGLAIGLTLSGWRILPPEAGGKRVAAQVRFTCRYAMQNWTT